MTPAEQRRMIELQGAGNQLWAKAAGLAALLERLVQEEERGAPRRDEIPVWGTAIDAAKVMAQDLLSDAEELVREMDPWVIGEAASGPLPERSTA